MKNTAMKFDYIKFMWQKKTKQTQRQKYALSKLIFSLQSNWLSFNEISSDLNKISATFRSMVGPVKACQGLHGMGYSWQLRDIKCTIAYSVGNYLHKYAAKMLHATMQYAVCSMHYTLSWVCVRTEWMNWFAYERMNERTS